MSLIRLPHLRRSLVMPLRMADVAWAAIVLIHTTSTSVNPLCLIHILLIGLQIIFASIGQQTSETRPLSSNPPNTTPQNFEHQIRFTGAPQNISQRSEVCHDWMRGKCSRTPCRFRHSEVSQ